MPDRRNVFNKFYDYHEIHGVQRPELFPRWKLSTTTTRKSATLSTRKRPRTTYPRTAPSTSGIGRAASNADFVDSEKRYNVGTLQKP